MNRFRAVVAVAVGVGSAAGLVAFIRTITYGEAQVNSWLVDAIGLADSRSIGAAVVFPSDGRWIGFLVSAGCSAALPMVPPLLIASMFVAVGRVSWRRALTTTVATAALLVVVNQIRLAVVVASMRGWGFELGYQRSHVLIGSAITTVGLVLVALLFVIALGRGHRRGVTRHA